MSKKIVCACLLWLGLNAGAPLFAQQELSAQHEAWVIVLADPRPLRAKGWETSGYGSTGAYSSNVLFARIAKQLAKDYNVAITAEWFIDSLGYYCIVVRGAIDPKLVASDERVQWIQTDNSFKGALNLTQTVEPYLPQTLTDAHLPTDKTGLGVRIAIIDSAIDASHPDLKRSVVLKKNFVDGDKPQNDAESHGTSIAGTIAADGNAELGTRGIAPDADLIGLRACWELSAGDTVCDTLSLARALNAAAMLDLEIINLSLSGPKDRLLDELVTHLIDSNKIVVAAHDPDRSPENRFPTPQPGVVYAKEISEPQKAKPEKNFSSISAPGERFTTKVGGGYKYCRGHSIAAAFVSGSIALELQSNRN